MRRQAQAGAVAIMRILSLSLPPVSSSPCSSQKASLLWEEHAPVLTHRTTSCSPGAKHYCRG